MNSLKRSNRMKYVALAVLAIALGSGLSNAQEAEGKFNLPFTARWGGMVLTPGPYSFTYVTRPGGPPLISVRRGNRTLGMIPGYLAGNQQSGDPSHLTAVRVGGAYRISALQLSELGTRVGFVLPRGEAMEAAQATRLARNVPVVRTAK